MYKSCIFEAFTFYFRMSNPIRNQNLDYAGKIVRDHLDSQKSGFWINQAFRYPVSVHLSIPGIKVYVSLFQLIHKTDYVVKQTIQVA